MGRISNYLQSNFFIIIVSLIITNCLSLSSQKEDTSFEDDLVPATHVLPKQIFNEGKPFYVDKDPISGQLDFSSKKPAGIEPETNEVIDTQMKSVILNSLSPNIHDYLNLPVKYSSSKFVYPLVSSSYANLKYQGNNKNFMSHIKDPSTSTTTSPKYYTLSRTTSETKFIPTKTSTFSTFSPTISTSQKTTSPSTVSSSIIRNTSVPTKAFITSTTEFSSTPSKTSTEKPTYKPTATLSTEKTTIKTTQKPEKTAATKKIITTLFKKLPPLPTTIPVKTSFHTTIPLKTSAEPQSSTTTTTSSTTTTTTTTTPATTATTSTTRPPTTLSTTPSSTTLHTTVTRSTIRPTIGWEDYYDPDFYDNHPSPSKYPPLFISSTERNYLTTNEPSLFRPISSPTAFTTMNPAAVYSEVANKKDPNKMSLMDLFNALAEEDYSSGSGSSYGVEQSGNLKDNILPSIPAPFTLQKATANTFLNNSTHSSQNSTGITLSTSSNTSYVPNAVNFPSSVNVPNIENVPHGSNFASVGNAPGNMGFSVPQTDFPDDHKEYVRYEVQQPTVMQQYRPVPNTNNIVISPDQNSASFVVGSQQSVHHSNYMGSVDKVPLFDSTDYMNVKSHSKAPSSIDFGTEHVHAPEYHTYQDQNWNEAQVFRSPSSSNINYNQEVNHELYDSVKIKFPNEEDQKSKIHSGVIQPEALTQNQGNIIFPKSENDNEVNKNSPKIPDRIDKIVFSEEKPSIQQTSFAEPQEEHKKEILTLNKYNLQKKVNIPTLPEDLTPPAPPEPSDQKMRHHLYRPSLLQPQEPHLYHNDEFIRKKFVPSSLYRSKVDHSLPNILPQFRPNAKISHGHSVITKEPGNIRIAHNKMRYPHRSLPPPPPQLSHSQYNRAPIGTHLNVKVTGNDDGNRRIFTVPVPSPPLHLQIVDRMYVKPPIINQIPPLGFNDNYHHPAPLSPRRHFHSNIEQPQKPQQPELTEKLYLEDDRIVNDSPKQEEKKEVPQLEPVITLQMLKTQKKSPNSSKTNDNIPDSQKSGSEPPVYVVYPVKQSSQVDLLATAENPSENFSKHPAEHNYPEHDYQNTPFSPLRDHNQEPVLMKVKDKSQSLNTFPYRLEKPDSKIDRYDDNHDNDDDSDYGMDVVRPRIVNSGFNRKQDSYMNTEIPIAVAYTPTEPNLIHHNHNYSDDRYFDFQNHEQNYENDFMAPFFPSMSLGTITNSPNSWSVYPGTTEGYDKNYINRADFAQNMRQGSNELSTRKFDPDQFQPELQGGFKPIYPPDYKIRNSDEESEEVVQVTESNSLLPSTTTSSLSTKATTSPQTAPTVSTSTISNSPAVTSIISTTSKPTERKKTKFEASLESLLFGDDEDFEDAEENNNKNS